MAHVQPRHHDTKSIAGSSDTIGVDVVERRDDSYGETDANVVSVEGKINRSCGLCTYKILHSQKSFFTLFDLQMPLWNTMM